MQQFTLTSPSFWGRSREVEELGALLADPSCRLLTLVGPGGIGKTRLAVELAARARDLFPDGCFFVSLAPLNRANELLTAIAEATPFRFQQDQRRPRDQFLDYLHEKQAQQQLLVLDNFEHLLESVDLVFEILSVTTNLKILVTSREALNLQEEWVRQIAGLAYPQHVNAHAIDDYGAVQLFLDRARRLRGDFDLAEDRQSVVEICRLVEGMPLAIELAVGWLTTLRPADIAQELQHNLDMLATRSRNLPERHRTLRSVFSHSWQLMSEGERDAFQKLSIFRGGCTREAARVVAGASLPTLARLIDQSLVRLNAAGRYEMHELLRQYGAEQLAAADQTAAVERAYIDYYLGLLRDLERDIKSQQQLAALDSIATNFENIRHAWQHAAEQQHLAALDQAVESLHWFADMRGRYHEVVPLLQSAIELFPSAPGQQQTTTLRRIQARLVRLIVLGNIRREHDLLGQIDACLAAARARQDQAEIAFCLMVSGIVAGWEAGGDFHHAETTALFQKSSFIYEALGDPFYHADALSWLACSIPHGADDTEKKLLRRSLALRQAIGDRNGIAWITFNLSAISFTERDYLAGEQYARQTLALMREIGSVKGIIQAGFKLAHVMMLKGDLEEVQALVDELRGLAEETNNLDGKTLAAAMLSCLACVMDEAYAEGAALVRKHEALAQKSYLGGYPDPSAHMGLALANCGLGQYAAARQAHAAVFSELQHDPGSAIACLVIEAVARAHEGRQESATELLGLAFHQATWASGWLHRWPLLTRLLADLGHQLGEEVYQAAWERGASLDRETTVQSLFGAKPESLRPPEHQSLLEPLSTRELEVLRLIADGLSNRDIARRLVLTVGTVKVHTRNIYSKLSVNSRTQALAQAARFHLL